MENATLYWMATTVILIAGAGILFLMMLAATQKQWLDAKYFTYLCITGVVSAVSQALLLLGITIYSELFGFSLIVLTALGILAGVTVLIMLREFKISSQTAAALLFVGHVVYPAFLVIFMLWSQDLAPR